MKSYKEVDYGINVDDSLNTICYSNCEGFCRIINLYARPGDTIVDPTYGNGVFWNKIDKSKYKLYLTDLRTDNLDMCALPYASESVDMVVNDPPYRYIPRKKIKNMKIHKVTAKLIVCTIFKPLS